MRVSPSKPIDLSIPFQKYSGCGNDFICIDNRRRAVSEPSALHIPLLCDRHWGIGADGLIFLELSQIADFRMSYWNRDGSQAALCGNGLRCLARFLLQIGLPRQKYRIEIEDHILQIGYSSDGDIYTEMAPVDHVAWSIPFAHNATSFTIHSLLVGVPHSVLFVEKDLKDFPLSDFAPAVRYDPRFAPQGTNVNIVQKTGKQSLHLRTYERGVEGETRACGTGATAAALAAHRIYSMGSPIAVHTSASHCLTISFRKERDRYCDIRQSGEALFLFQGTFPLRDFSRSKVERKSKKI